LGIGNLCLTAMVFRSHAAPRPLGTGIYLLPDSLYNLTLSDKDSVWKEAIDACFHDFLGFFFPHIAGDIDFDKGYEFLDKELKRILREAGTGKRYADILVKVYLRDGQEEWLQA